MDAERQRELAEIGAEILDATVRLLRRFLWFQRPEHYDLLALWAAHTWIFRAFPFTPRLDFTSKDPGSGKTLSMDLTALLCASPYTTGGITGPALRIKVHNDKPTLALDEADVIFGSTGRRREDHRAILNTGFKHDGAYDTAVGNGTSTRRWQTFCPVMFAGIGSLPDTLADRSLIIPMRKPPRSAKLTRYSTRLHQGEFESCGAALGEWARSVAILAADIIPDDIEGVLWRGQDISEPLLILGELAGDEWRERARAAVASVLANRGTDITVTPPDIVLLADIRTVFDGKTRIATSALVEALLAMEGRPWADLWQRDRAPAQMADMLRPFAIAAKPIRFGRDIKRGYLRSQFTETWDRMLPAIAEAEVPA